MRLRNILLAAWFGGTAMTGAIAQTAPQPDPTVRALQATASELMQAWTASRTAMISLQDQNAALEKKVSDLEKQRSDLEQRLTKALPPIPPPTKHE